MPKVALIGRPNVGKSSLFNRLIGSRQAIVEDSPGLTRDRHYALLTIEEGLPPIWLIDTGGFLGEAPGMEAQVAQQVRFAVEEADLLLWVTEAPTGVHPADEEFAAWLRTHRHPSQALWLIANKADNETLTQIGHDLYRLGIEPIFFVSATSGRGIAQLKAALRDFAAKYPSPTPPLTEGPRFALIGRPNVGKSSLLNSLLRAPRAIVSDLPGTTRDALYEPSTWQGRSFFWVDTAGLRRKSHIPPHSIERYAALRSLEALSRADVVLLVLEATEPLTAQDLTLLRQAEKLGKGIVLLLNKIDLLLPSEVDSVRSWVQRKVQPLDPVPILSVSALTGQGVKEIPKAAFSVYDAGQHTIPTRQLNDQLLPILRQQPPPLAGTLQPSIRFLQQIGTAPPTFLLQARHSEKIRLPYLQFVAKQIRKVYPFPGWMLRLKLKEMT